MQIPLEISYRDVEKTDDIENLIYTKAAKLDQICDHLTRCDVTLEQPQKHQRSGSPYTVRIEMTVPPGHELVAKREAGKGDLHEPLSSVIRDAFDAARRQLQELVERQRKETKSHVDQEVNAYITNLFPAEGYGFLKNLEDRDVYFHKNSVMNDAFDQLEIGSGVRYVEELGEKGPQATVVQLLDRHVEM
ncbi:HPF/RaiA family ribosome-associated protein [bacterium]|nr:HPF/RaiA family ribosome-associated protein [bacterium]